MNLAVGSDILLRDLELGDASDLALLADNAKVAATLRDRFPQPYRLEDALGFIVDVRKGGTESAYAIEIEGRIAGVIGVMPGQDVYRQSAEIGYWLGEAYWGRGIMTRVLIEFSAWVFTELPFRRLYGVVFSSNPASARVLEKAGYVREGVMREHVTKGGEMLDEWHYALLNPET
jgi:ribosomal-protein-alanine N-acetyltransferase